MKIAKLLLISAVIALAVNGIFAEEQTEEFLGGQPIEIEKEIINFVVGGKEDFIDAAKEAESLAHVKKKYEKLAIEALKNRFFKKPNTTGYDKEKAQAELFKLSENGTLNPFALAVLLDAGADLKGEDVGGNTALIYAARGKKEAPGVVKLLIEKGADPNKQNKSGTTPLMAAAIKGYTKIAEKLIEAKNINLDIQSKFKNTALMWAANHGKSEIVEMLIKAGADLNIKNSAGNTALSLAEKSGHTEIASMLKEAIKEQNK